MYMVLHAGGEWPKGFLNKMIGRSAIMGLVPYPWIDLRIKAALAFPLQGETEKDDVVYLIDGDLAWAYIVPKDAKAVEDDVVSLRFDAIEFAPSAAKVVRQVFEELRADDLVPTTKQPRSASWWWDFQTRLHKRSGLEWRTPAELNPTFVFE